MIELPLPEPAVPSVQNFGFEVRTAWRRNDPEVAADAIDFWRRNDLLLPDVDPAERARDLIAAAYKDGRLAAVATATLGRIDLLRARFAIIRGATDKAFRRSHAQLALAVPSRQALEAWALAHSEEKIAGAIAFVNAGEWGDFARFPVWPESELALAGYADDGSQVRVRWFEHFRYESEDGRPPVPVPTVPPELVHDVELREAWRRGDARIEADAVDFWARLGILPSGANPSERARDIVFAAYKGDRMVGVTTVELGVLPQVRARLAMLRGAVDPEFRRSHIGMVMLFRARQALEAWSAENPQERVAGLGAILESKELAGRQRQPYAPFSKMGVIGFTPDGRQIRVSWFEDFRLD